MTLMQSNYFQGPDLQLSAWEERKLGELLLFASEGNPLAALDAALFCERECIPPPQFLTLCLFELFTPALKGRSLGRKGRGGNPFAEASKHAVRQWRISMVDAIRTAQETASCVGLSKLIEDEVQLPSRTRKLILTDKLSGLGTTWADAFEVASLSLRGTPAACSRDWLEKVYHSKTTETSSYKPSEALLDALSIDWSVGGAQLVDLMNVFDFDVLGEISANMPEPK
jgi:hypothetical protein